MELTMEELENTIKEAYAGDSRFFALAVTTPVSEEVIIINHEDFMFKLNYLKMAYNDDLFLNNNEDVRITGFLEANSYADIEERLV